MDRTDTDFVPRMHPAKPRKREEWSLFGRKNRMVTGEYQKDRIVEGYKIVRTVSSGKMGKVYLCENINGNLLYIMKTIELKYSTKENIQRMYEEAKRMVNIPMHPNVLRIQTPFILNDVPHLILIYAKGVCEEGIEYGSSLRDLIDNHWKFNFLDILWIAVSVCRGMAHCQKHIKGFVHGDIKPENILLHPLNRNTDFGWGLTEYQVMISDFGGGKTPGYFVSDAHKPSDIEDDIYAFAKIMEELFIEAYRCGNMNASVYWDRFADGLERLLHQPYSSDVRRTLDFHSLYNGYAQTLETVLDLNSLGYCAEDILPTINESIRTQILEELNSCLRRWNLSTEEQERSAVPLHNLLQKPGVESVFLDDLPVTVLIQFRLAEFYFSNRQWEMFDNFMGEIKAFLRGHHGSVFYKGIFRYSAALETDAGILEQISNVIRNREVDTELLICAIRLDVHPKEWLWQLFEFITMHKQESLPELQKRISSLVMPDDKNSEQMQYYHLIMGSYYLYFGQNEKAYPHCKYLAELDGDCQENYDIYTLEGACQNKNFMCALVNKNGTL